MNFSRREMLRVVGLAGLGIGLGACSSKSRTGSLTDIVDGRVSTATIIDAAGEILPRENERFVFAMFKPKSQDRFEGGTAKVWIARDQKERARGPFTAQWHDHGLGDKGIYSTRIGFPKEGAWLTVVEVTPEGRGEPVLGGATLTVGRRYPQPIPGEAAVSVASPTTKAAGGVDPICTRRPRCPFHEISLDQALKGGGPVVLYIGTPAFCQSRTCGPVLDAVIEASRSAPPAVKFVHIEVFADDEEAPAKQRLAPAASAWKLETEPVTYFITGGRVAERFLGPADSTEIADAVKALTG